ncbi:MAG: hypothetical protein A4E35_01135 [Methanoregula sp. PtaU1.Bin051]|nr:MAG: hypothetical protein A4E35_01135 [Methanoregula sp. PtaU1.Bin051]
MSFEEIPHTADIKIRARAPTLASLFSEILKALMQVMYGESRGKTLKKEISLTGEDTESLLLDFLSEILYISEVEAIVFADARIIIKNNALHAVLQGEPFDIRKHSGGTEVKGISYSGLLISSDANGYMAEIVFDV